MLSSKANLSKKLMLASRNKQKKNNIIGYCCTPKNKFLITINVLGCAGPLRFVVNEDDVVDSVIDTALKLYARQRRLPVLVSHANDFLLYCANAEFEALSPSAQIGSQGVRNFMLGKKKMQPQMRMTDRKSSDPNAQKGISCWKSWFNNLFTFKLLSH
ncbi:hypothetical protein L484_025423 [Morus notabilis]|uniref:DUF7054 domain-containing protein n=1 Tax=Morus notabilis TaxID=981085 RepID=W9R2I7_9ROSA|nr:uncharacterized protein LOC21408124 [Morus notabilis]EXB65342.1 hypothetical protein L484_025423 [Morus notabilis]